MVTKVNCLRCLGIITIITFSSLSTNCGDSPRPSILNEQHPFVFAQEIPSTRIDIHEPGLTRHARIKPRRRSLPSGRRIMPRKNSDSVNLELVAIIREEIERRSEEERAATRRTATEIAARRTESRVKIIAAVGTAVVSVIGAIGTLIYHFNECGK